LAPTLIVLVALVGPHLRLPPLALGLVLASVVELHNLSRLVVVVVVALQGVL